MTRGANLLSICSQSVVLDLLAEAMAGKLDGSKGFLIDGYPREVAQGQEFEKTIKPCSKILYFELSDEVMTQRLLNRGKTSGRVDDNEETIKKRLNTFHQHSKPVVEAYKDKTVIVRAIEALNRLTYSFS